MPATIELERDIPRWAVPLTEPARYKGARGGRAAGKSHYAAESLVEEMLCDPSLRVVCIREIQRSLKFSAKSLVERKIRDLGVSDQFDVLNTEIRRRGGTGVMIFEGLQDHTADSLKSLEGFERAWAEEAQRLSQRSLEILIPTIRAPGSEIWFTWNPNQPTDPVERFFGRLDADGDEDHRLVTVTYKDNPFCPAESKADAERMRRMDPDAYAHIWMGGFNVKSDAQVLAGKWRIDEFEPADNWDGPYYGADWGFSRDPTAITRSWVADNRLWVEHEAGGVGVGLDDIPDLFNQVPGAKKHTIRADNARPETIEYLNRKHDFGVEPAPKWSGSVEDGIEFLRKFEEIVIHERCERTAEEARLWSYKTDRLTGDPLPQVKKGHDHYMDTLRYALSPLIQGGGDFDPSGWGIGGTQTNQWRV